MIGTHKVVALIGSTKLINKKIFEQAEIELTKCGFIVIKPALFGDDVTPENIEDLTTMCTEKLQFADTICVCGHCGESTKKRIEEAEALGKEILLFENTTIQMLSKQENMEEENMR